MRKGTRYNEWLKQAAVALGYALVYEMQHPFSPPQFLLGSAVRLIWLLMLPYRYWPAMIAGELVPNWLAVYPGLDQFGPLWGAVRAIPPITVAMPIVWACRERLILFPSKHLVNIKALLVCVLAASVAWTTYSYVAVAAASIRPDTLRPTLDIALTYFIGNYFAILAIVPWALIARFDYLPGEWREMLRRAQQSRLLLEGLTVMLPATVLLAIVSHRPSSDHPQLVIMAMFLPAAWLTLRHGWRAAAFGGSITILCAALLLPSEAYNVNAEVVQTELFLAVTITSLFALGARISAHVIQERVQVDQSQNVRHQARQNFLQGELRMRQTAQALEYVAGTLHVTNGRLLQHIRRIYPHVENEGFYKQAVTAQNQVYQLAESLHPIAWRERGLPAALQETIGRALDEAGIAYRCQVTGRGFSRMQSAVLTAAYRSTCEAVVYVTSRLSCTSVRVTLRGGETNGARWVFLAIEGLMDDMKVARAISHSPERQRLAAKLGASGFDLGDLTDHVRIFEGDLHHRSGHERMRVTMLLHDPDTSAKRKHARASAPVRLWVH
jgi:two-component system, NarL family, sensor histidine kinase FusK